MNLNQKLIIEDKIKQLRKEVLVMISKFEYKHALTKCKEIIQLAKKLFFNEPLKYFYSFLTDSMLLSKCFIREDKFSKAEEVLIQGWSIFNKYITNENYKITNVIFEQRGEDDLEDIQKYINTTTDLENGVG